MAAMEMEKVVRALPELLAISSRVWIDYGEGADARYISFRKPQGGTDSIVEDNVVYHYDGDLLVGMTVIGVKAAFG